MCIFRSCVAALLFLHAVAVHSALAANSDDRSDSALPSPVLAGGADRPGGLKATKADSTVTVNRPGSGSGTVIANSGALNCGATCSGSYADGTALLLTATADAGSQFTGWLGKCIGTAKCAFNVNGSATVTATFATNGIGSPRIDVDGNGVYDALTDGLLILRHLFGLTGNALISGAIASGATRTTAAQIEAFLIDIKPLLDVDGNLTPDALTDGLLSLRYLFGLRGGPLIASAIGPGATRTTAASIETGCVSGASRNSEAANVMTRSAGGSKTAEKTARAALSPYTSRAEPASPME